MNELVLKMKKKMIVKKKIAEYLYFTNTICRDLFVKNKTEKIDGMKVPEKPVIIGMDGIRNHVEE